MRCIGFIKNKEHAELFGDYLTSQDIQNQINEDEGEFSVWVYSDNHLDAAFDMLQQFKLNPEASQYQQAKGARRVFDLEQERQVREFAKNQKNFKNKWSQSQLAQKGVVTLTLMALCLVVAFGTNLGRDREAMMFLYITDFGIEGNYLNYGFLSEFLGGQIWRIFTPMFLHFGFMHLIFNLLWLYDLGNMIELRHGAGYYLLLVLVISGLSNLAQFIFSGPLFGGMSGVVYGLLGFLWIRGKFDPKYFVQLHPHIVIMMIIWFLLGFTGLIGNMANLVHGVGLAVGMIWGYLSSKHWAKKITS